MQDTKNKAAINSRADAKTRPEDNESWQPSRRILNLYRDHMAARPGLGAERALHYTEFFKKHAHKYKSAHICMAQALKFHLERRTIKIFDEEYIVGSHTEHRIGAICFIELAGNVMLEDLYKFHKRSTNPLHVEKKYRGRLFRAMLYWMFRNLAMRAFPFKEKIAYLLDQLNATYFVINEAGGIAHFLPGYEYIIQTGTIEMRRLAIKRLQEIQKEESNTNQNQIDFLQARLIALDTIEMFADRYAALASDQNELDIVKNLSHVPRKPAKNLLQALQMIWFFQLLIQVESLDQGISLGRIDQYLYPLYLKEKEAGTLDEAAFKNQFSAFCLKLSEIIPLFSDRLTAMFGGLPNGQALTLGGITAEGKDATNPVTFMLLDVLDKFKTRQPNWHARVAKNSSARYLEKVYEIIASGGGSPALYNDDVILPALRRQDFPEDRLYNYATVGCVEPALPGESFTSSDAAIFNIPVALDIVLGEGKRIDAGIFSSRIGKRSTRLKNIKTFEMLKEEVFLELAHRIEQLKISLDKIELANARIHPTPLSSLTVKGCLESARDLSQGGASINASGIQGVGIADLANSLEAIREYVYERKEYSLTDIANACIANFANDASMQARLLRAPKYGNNKDSVDTLAAEITVEFDRLVSLNTNTRGGRWMPGGYSMTCHRSFGSHMAALPSGRVKGESLADGIAPGDGTDMLGPTASLNSTIKLNQVIFSNGVNLNMKFDAKTLTDAGGSKILNALLGGYFDQGGMQVQVNVLDQAVLEDAMLNPDNHRNLLVRISGYCAYFVDLTPAMQQELLDRTQQKT